MAPTPKYIPSPNSRTWTSADLKETADYREAFYYADIINQPWSLGLPVATNLIFLGLGFFLGSVEWRDGSDTVA
jgi:hypothetical protein